MGGANQYTRHLLQIWDQVQVCNGVLCWLYAQATDQQNHVQQIIPKKFQEKILVTLHQGVAGGHLWIHKTPKGAFLLAEPF
jgi:hypothetical protein